MRDVTKSLLSFSWSMSLFGLQQTGNLLANPDPTRPKPRAAEAFDSVSRATEDQLGDTLRELFRAGDKMQRGMVDMFFGAVSGPGASPGGMMRMATQAMNQAGGCCRREDGAGKAEATGWGPMPEDEAE